MLRSLRHVAREPKEADRPEHGKLREMWEQSYGTFYKLWKEEEREWEVNRRRKLQEAQGGEVDGADEGRELAVAVCEEFLKSMAG